MAIIARLVAGTLALVVAVGSGVSAQPQPPVFSEEERQAVNQAATRLTAGELVDAVRRAEADDLDAQVLVGQAYFLSRSPHRDPAKAIPFLEKAAARGHPLAQYGLGASYLMGEGVFADEALGERWIRKAVDQGLAQAMYLLGELYEAGRVVERDAAEAVRLLQLAAEQGNPWGQAELGRAFELGLGVPRDARAAAEWYRKAALQGNTEGQTLLAFLYLSGSGVPRDVSEGTCWLRAAAEQGHPVAQFNLGIACRIGDGVPKSKTDAAAWLTRASDQGHAAATLYLAQMHWSGDLGRDSWTRGEGLGLFAQSATQGYALAALVLGDIYMAERNARLACTWLATARELAKTPEWQEEWAVLRPFDDEELRKRLPKLLAEARKKLTPQQLSDCEDEAVRWLRQQGIVSR
jgi:TPR repeat protein